LARAPPRDAFAAPPAIVWSGALPRPRSWPTTAAALLLLLLMTDASSLASGWTVWAEVFDEPKTDEEEDEGPERFDRLGAARSRFGEPDTEAEPDAPLIPLPFDPPADTSPRRRGERGPPPVLVGEEWRAGLGIVDGARGKLQMNEKWPARL
jgi:hypothetical protein